MQVRAPVLILAMLVLVPLAHADAPFATARFEKEDEATGKRTPIVAATLSDFVCLVVHDISTADGDHPIKLVIYDGGGNEVYQSTNVITAEDRKWGRRFCYGYNPKREVPGTWWYVVELDGAPLVSAPLVVQPAR